MSAQKENTRLIVLVSCVSTIGGFLFGFDSGVINGTVDGLRLAFNANDIGTGFNVASMLLGCAAGAFCAGTAADIYGRKSLLIVTAILFVFSAWGSGISESSSEFVLYRILGGFAVGAASVMAPAYISEVAPARYRGRLATMQQIAIILGLFCAFLSNYFLAEFAGASTAILWMDFEAWRWMFWIELIPATLFFFALMFIPESPRYLTMQDQKNRAMEILTRLYGEKVGKSKSHEICDSLTQEHPPRMGDLLDADRRKIRKIVWVGIGLATFQQLVGINVVFYYGAVLWQAVGFSESDALFINILSGAVSIGACLLTIALIERIGRKPLLLIGSVGMSLTLALMVLAFAKASLGENGDVNLGQWGTLALVAANGYVFFFNMSWGPVMWVMLGEMFPNQIRGSGLAVSGLAQWVANFAITMTFPLLLTSVGLIGAYGFYTLCAMLSVVFIIKMVHETKGIELESMPG